MSFLTASNWIELETGIRVYYPKIIENYDLPESSKSHEFLLTLGRAFNALEELGEDLKEIMAYTYQTNRAMAISRRLTLEKLQLDFSTRIIESKLLSDELRILSLLDSFFKDETKKAIGSPGIELGIISLKEFDAKRIYIILKTYLESIYNSVINFIQDKAKSIEIKNLIRYFKKDSLDEEISLIYFRKFLEKEKIEKNFILDSLFGSEVLIFSFSLAENVFKKALYSIIEMKRREEREEIEKGIFELYERMDKEVFERFLKLNLKEEEAKEITSKFKFSDRRLC